MFEWTSSDFIINRADVMEDVKSIHEYDTHRYLSTVYTYLEHCQEHLTLKILNTVVNGALEIMLENTILGIDNIKFCLVFFLKPFYIEG